MVTDFGELLVVVEVEVVTEGGVCDWWVGSLSCDEMVFILSDWVLNGLLCRKEYDRGMGLYTK